jgi:hypothetical protein
MPPKRKPKQKLREITDKDTQNLHRSEQLPEPQTPIVIEIDHSRKRMSSNSSRTDSLVLVSDGAPPSPKEPDGIQTIDDHASYSSFSRRVNRERQAKEARDASKSRERENFKSREANSRREVEKRFAETAAEANRRKKAAEDALEAEANRRKKAADDALDAEAHDNAVAKNTSRQAYHELVKAQYAERETQKAEHQRLKDAFLFSNPDDQSVQSTQSTESTTHSDLDNDSLRPNPDPDDESFTASSRPIRKRKADQIYMSNVAKPIVLVDEISGDLATKFLQHCERPEVIQQNLQWDQVIQPYALERIRLRLTNPKFHHQVLPEHVDLFPLRLVDGQEVCQISLIEIATIIKKMFNITPEVSDEQSLEQQGREHSFQYTMKSEDLEGTTILQFKRLCTNHIRHMSPELDNRISEFKKEFV